MFVNRLEVHVVFRKGMSRRQRLSAVLSSTPVTRGNPGGRRPRASGSKEHNPCHAPLSQPELSGCAAHAFDEVCRPSRTPRVSGGEDGEMRASLELPACARAKQTRARSPPLRPWGALGKGMRAVHLAQLVRLVRPT